LIEWPDTTTSKQVFLNRGPKGIHADFPTLIATPRNQPVIAKLEQMMPVK